MQTYPVGGIIIEPSRSINDPAADVDVAATVPIHPNVCVGTVVTGAVVVIPNVATEYNAAAAVVPLIKLFFAATAVVVCGGSEENP